MTVNIFQINIATFLGAFSKKYNNFNCDGLGRCFRLVCIYACAAVFFDATVCSVNKDLYILTL